DRQLHRRIHDGRGPDAAVGELDLDLPARAHREFVDGVVDRLLQEDVDAILGVAAVAEAADIHARPQADVLERRKGLDARFGIVRGHGRYRESDDASRGMTSAIAGVYASRARRAVGVAGRRQVDRAWSRA